MNSVRSQLNLFLIALGFLSRIPVSDNLDFSQQNLNRASRFFPLVGWLIGGICALVFYFASKLFSTEISVLMSMLTGVLLTGCFHEDGLADSSDGFGGGWTTRQKLNIMKDSRVGTYGSVALWFVLTFKFAALSQLDSIVIAILLAHPLSRGVSTAIIYALPYVTDAESSKVKPLAESNRVQDLVIALIIAFSALLLVPNHAWIIALVAILSGVMARHFLKKQIGGFTGDTLGATQQVTEISIYLTLLAMQNIGSGASPV